MQHRGIVSVFALAAALLSLAVSGGFALAQQPGELWERLGHTATGGAVLPGHVTAIGVSPNYENDETVFIGLEAGGLWRGTRTTLSSGLVAFNWTQVTGIPTDATVTAIAFAPGFDGNSVPTAPMAIGRENGSYMASDTQFTLGASAFTLTDPGGDPQPITDIEIWTPGTHYAVISTAGAGIWRTTNAPFFPPVPFYAVGEEDITTALARSGNTLYAAVHDTTVGDALVRTTDGVSGGSWSTKGTFAGAVPTDVEVASVGGALHAHLGTTNRGMWRTTDITAASPSWMASCDGSGSNVSYRVNDLALCPIYDSDRELFEGRSDGAWFSYNFGGSGSSPCSPSPYHGEVTAVAYSPGFHTNPGTRMYCDLFEGTENGLFVHSCDGGQFKATDQGSSEPSVVDVALGRSNGGAWLASNPLGLVKSLDGTEMLTYNAFYGDVPNVVAVAPTPDYDSEMACSPSENTLYYTDGAEVFESTDRGSSWTALANGWMSTTVHDIAVSPDFGNDSTVFAATNLGLARWSGTSWDFLAANTVPNVSALALPRLYQQDYVVFASHDTSGSGGIWISTDAGDTATRFNGMQDPDVVALTLSPDFADQDWLIFAARQDLGIWFTSRYGLDATDANWCELNDGMASLDVRDVAASLSLVNGFVQLVAATAVGPWYLGVDPAADTNVCGSYGNWAASNYSLDLNTTSVSWGNAFGHTVMLGTGRDGAVFSDDEGLSFNQATTGYGTLPSDTWATAIHPFFDNIVFTSSRTQGVFVSTNGGAAFWPWNQSSTCFTGARGIGIVGQRSCANPANQDMVWIGGFSGTAGVGILNRTILWNGSRYQYDQDTWHPTSVTTADVEQIETLGQGPTSQVWAASSDQGFFTTTDCAGSAWSLNNPGGVGSSTSVRFGNDTVSAPSIVSGNSTGTQQVGSGQWKFYRIDVPEGALTLNVGLSALSGNPDLYLKYGAPPDVADYDAASTNVAGDESVCLDDLNSVEVIWSDDFETDKGWVTAPGGNPGEWARGAPAGGGGTFNGNPDPPAAFSGSNVFGNDLTGDYNANVAGATLTSPSFSALSHSAVVLRFQRWLNVEQPAWDQATVQISKDGTNWTQVWQNPSQITDSAWSSQELDISSVAAGQSSVYVRYRLDTDGSVEFSGWNVDDVVVTGGAKRTGAWYVGVYAPSGASSFDLTATVDGACQTLPVWTSRQTISAEDFDGAHGWILDNGSGTSAEWEVRDPLGAGTAPNQDPAVPFSFPNVLGTDLTGTGTFPGDYEPSVANAHATSPPIDCSNHLGVQLTYQRWLNVERSQWDQARVLVANDGASYIGHWVNDPLINHLESAWTPHVLDIWGTADNDPDVTVRFSLDSDGSVQYSGWNIDDVVLSGFPSTTPATLPLDQWDYYAVEADGNETDIQVWMNPMGGDPDLYIRYGGLPTESAWMYRPFLGGGTDEIVCINPVAAGTYYIAVRGASSSPSTYALSVSKDQGCSPSPFTADRNVAHRIRPAQLVQLPSSGENDVRDPGTPQPIVGGAISWGTVNNLGVYRNISGTWTQRNGVSWGTLANLQAQSIIQPTSGDVFCGSNGNLFVSEYPDEGATTWVDVGAWVAGSPSWDITDFHENVNGDLMVSMDGAFTSGGGVWLSGNKGKAWMQLNQGFDSSTQNITDLVGDSGAAGVPIYYASSDGSSVYDRTITPNAPPTLLSLSSNSAGASEQKTITVGGTGFSFACISGVTADCPFGNAVVAWFGGTPVPVSTGGNDSFQVATPVHSPGVVDFTVMNPDTRESVSLPFTFLPDGNPNLMVTVVKDGGTARINWSPPGRVRIERSSSIPFVPERSVIAVGSSWTDPENVLSDANSYYYRVVSQ